MRNLFVYIGFFSALVVSGCSSEEDAVSQSFLDRNVVAFSTNGQKGMTRSGATVTSLTTFNVWSSTADGNAYIGALDGSGEAFTYDALSEVFKSDVNHYWPSVGTLNFFASNVFTQMDEYHSDQTPHDAVVEYTNDGSKDIVCATVRTGTKTIPYPLLFHHVLSQVKVTAEAKDKTQDLQYRVVGITMTTQDDGLYHYATTTGGIGTWELNDESSTRAYAFGANMPSVFEKDGRFASTDYWNVLPCVNDLVFSIQYQVIQNGVVISDFTGANAKTVTVSSPGLLSEKKYTYNFKLGIDNDDVITFTLTISDWEDTVSEDPIDVSSLGKEGGTRSILPCITYTSLSKLDEISDTQSPGVRVTVFSPSIINHEFFEGVGKIELSDEIPTSIGASSFSGSSELTSIIFPDCVENIGRNAFTGCRNLSSVILPNTLKSIDYATFSACKSLTSITIPSSVTSIAQDVFYNSGLISISIPENVTTIGVSAFQDCESLISATILANVTSISITMFYNCSNLTTVSLPPSVTSIGMQAFYGCKKLVSLTINSVIPPTLESGALPSNVSGRKIYVPAESVSAYKKASGWSKFASEIVAIP